MLTGDRPQRVINMKQEAPDKPLPQRRLFGQAETPLGGKTAKEALEEWIEARKQPHTPTQAELDRYERMQVEAGGPIPARFRHLQYLNKRRR